MNRIISIDVFRGITMFLMIWVNDFWTLKHIPKWLLHAKSGEDYLGFSDLIFPWFLFVMGMSIPFSFENRLKRGETNFKILKHTIFRTIALLIMGLFHMNMEMYNHEASIISKPFFVILSTLAFFMIWNKYPKSTSNNNLILIILPIIGMIILMIMLLIYSGKDYENNSIGFNIHWWGILGLIGWVYIISASIYFIFRKSYLIISIIFFLCLGLNILSNNNIPYKIFLWQSEDWIPGSGGLQALAFGGILTSLTLIKFNYKNNIKYLYAIFICMSVGAFSLGIISHNFFIINKINGTLTWVLFSLSSSLFLYTFIHWLVETKNKLNWYLPIQVAGSATLTCYLIPYFFYSFLKIIDIKLPLFFLTGINGLIKSLMFSFLVIFTCWTLSKIKIQIKV